MTCKIQYNFHKTIMGFVLCTLVITGCNVEKRQHRSGFNIDFVHRNAPRLNARNLSAIEHKKSIVQENPKETKKVVPLLASLSDDNRLLSWLNVEGRGSLTDQKVQNNNTTPCDRVVLMTGDELNVRIVEISSIAISYVPCDEAVMDSTNVNRSDVFMIVYANGTRELMRANLNDMESNVIADSEVSDELSPKDIKVRQRIIYFIGFVSILLSLLSWFLFLSFPFGAVVLALLSIILGLESITEFNSNDIEYRGKWLVITGLLLGMLGILVAGIAVMVFYIQYGF